jgi:hypothetical protein
MKTLITYALVGLGAQLVDGTLGMAYGVTSTTLLLAAGYAPVYAERALDDPALAAARQAIERVLTAHEPYPALAVDRHCQLVAANAAIAQLLVGVAPSLLAPPVNVLRLSLHPDGLAPRIVNFAQWRGHLLERLTQQIAASADATLSSLRSELEALPAPRRESSRTPSVASDGAGVFVPLQLATDAGVLSFLSTTTVFGTPVDVTLSELALECFFPADEATAAALRAGKLSRQFSAARFARSRRAAPRYRPASCGHPPI